MTLKKVNFTYIIPVVLGILLFFYFCDYKLLFPQNISWLAGDGDPGTMYVGSQYFLKEQWHFPIGHIQNYGYPFGSNIGLTDSIPLFGIGFKLFKNFIYGDFQYFGIWLLMSFVLQSICAFAISTKAFKNLLFSIVFTIFVTASPTLLYRLHVGHYSLTAQWIILISFYLYFFSEEYSLRKWLTLSIFAALIMPYFWLMTFIMFTAFSLKFFVQKNISRQTLLKNCAIFAGTAISIWLIVGTVSNKYTLAGGGFAFHGANLNTLFNTNDWTTLLPSLTYATAGQYEGYGYLGLGGICLVVSAIVLMVIDKQLRLKILNDLNYKVFGFILITFFLISTFPVWSLGKITIFSVAPIIKSLKMVKLFEIFRANGRFIWVVWYGLVFLSFNILNKTEILSKKLIQSALVVFILFQAWDISSLGAKIKDKKNEIKFDRLTEASLSKPLSKNYEHLFVIPNDFNPEWGDFAVKNNLSISSSYMARLAIGQIQYYLAHYDSFLHGNLDKDLMYATDLPNAAKFCENNQKNIDHYYIAPISKYFFIVNKNSNQENVSFSCNEIFKAIKKGKL